VQDAVIYAPYAQQPKRSGPWANLAGQMTFLVRASGDRDPLTLLPSIRRALAEIDPSRAISDVATIEGGLSPRAFELSLYLSALSAFALVAVLLAAIGVYGVMSYAVAQRTREIGVRMALGAGSGDVIRDVSRRAVLLIAGGLLCGIAGAAALGQFLSSQLWQVAPQDPATLTGASLLVVIVALGASWIPMRRAIALDPTAALRCE
jgi:putative ABC transport system permease protein